jgi:hypothetical protein
MERRARLITHKATRSQRNESTELVVGPCYNPCRRAPDLTAVYLWLAQKGYQIYRSRK